MPKLNWRPEAEKAPCSHKPKCMLWKTQDDRTVRLCEMSDQHIINIMTGRQYLAALSDKQLGKFMQEVARRPDLKFPGRPEVAGIEKTNEVIYAYRAFDNTDLVSSLEFEWQPGINAARCLATNPLTGNPTVRSHLLNYRASAQAHHQTSCGLHSFVNYSDAASYYYGAGVVACIVLSGIVVDVEWASPNVRGYLSEFAEIVTLWIIDEDTYLKDAYKLKARFAPHGVPVYWGDQLLP